MFEGNCSSKCSAPEFLAHMPGCQESSRFQEKHQLRVFGYPTTLPQRNQERIRSFLLSLQYPREEYILVQFWTPITTCNGRIMLTLSRQPFGISDLYRGLCRYRYYCIQKSSWMQEISELGALGRVFTEKSPQHCRNIQSFSIQDFPMKIYAENCGIVDYSAFPIFERGRGGQQPQQQQQQQCIGVLEFLSCRSSVIPDIWSLEYSDSGCTISHHQECKKDCPNVLESILDRNVLKYVRAKHGLPLIQIWAPCTCNSTSRLFCQWTSLDSNIESIWDAIFLNLSNGTYVESGKSLVGRAYLQRKSCFFGNTSQLDRSDYPLVHFIRTLGLTACFAVPLQTIHPKLGSLVLEVFLPFQLNCDESVGDVMKSFLSTMARDLSKYDIAFGLKETEELSVHYSHSDDDKFLYFDVYRKYSTPSTSEVHCVESSKEALTNAEVNISLDATQTGQVESAAENPDGDDQVQNNGKLQQFPSPGDQLLETLKTNDGHLLDMAESLKECCRPDEDQITFDMITQYFGHTKLADAAEKLGVSRSTLKRRCRDFGIRRWPWHKRNKVNHHIQSGARILAKSVPVGGKVNQESEIGCSQRDNDESGRDYCIIVKATYGNDVVKFHLWSNWGIGELYRELHKRFKLKVGSFKVKYKDFDGEWIMLSCNEDLHLHFETSRTSGESILHLSVFPDTL